MPARLKHTIVTIALFALLVGVFFANKSQNSEGTGPSGATKPSDALARYGFYLTDATAASGIDFVHQAPVLDPKLSNIMPEVAAMGASVTICDYDKDGLPDIYVTNSAVGSQNHLYRNLGNGKFEDVAAKMGVADLNKPGTGVCMGAVWGDFDNDGYPDLLVYKWGKPLLFHNNGGKSFTDVTAMSGLPAWVNANSATWVDYDDDGRLDILLCGYYPDNVDLWRLKNTRMMPESFEYANNGGRKYLLRNLGGGKFEDVTAKVGLNSHRWTLAVGAADLRGTGYPDLVLANDYGVTEFYANQQGQRFTEIGKKLGIAVSPKSGMNCSFGDVLDSGQLAIYVSDISSEGNLIQGNNLWVPQGTGDLLHYTNLADQFGVSLGGWSFGAQFGDLNNSGNQDIVLTNGFLSSDRNTSYWYDFGKVAGGNSSIISDAANWPPMGNRSLSGYEAKRIWLGNGRGGFSEVAQGVGYTDRHDGRAVALADLYNNGALDIVVANQRGPLLIYKNTVDPANQWIEFDLNGTRSNRDAYGAQLTLYWESGGRKMQQEQQVSAASGFCAQNDHRLHFGLGKDARIDRAVIKWPMAGEPTQTVFSPQIDTVVHIEEPRK